MKKNRLLAVKIFIALWLTSFVLLQILPIQSRFENALDGALLNIAFVLIISSTAIFWYNQAKSFKRAVPREIPLKKIHFIIRFSSFSTIMGNLFIYLDRVYIRGIDYSKGFRNARYQWVASTNSGSIISIMGNLMVPFSYCALFMGIFHWEVLKKRQRMVAILSGFCGQFSFAMLNGGRSNILLSIVFSFVVCILRRYVGKSFLPKFRGRTLYLSIGMAAVLSYVMAILYAFSNNDLGYLQLAAKGGGAKITVGYRGNPVINSVTHVALYLFHGIYYVSSVMSNNPKFVDMNHNISFRWLFSLLARTPLLHSYKMELPDFDGGNGNFIALPGILLYDYGYFGFFIVSIILGIMFGVTLKTLNSKENNYGVWELVITICILINLYMSMITLALGFGYFTFMIFAMISMELIARMKYGKSGWTKVKNNIGECCYERN